MGLKKYYQGQTDKPSEFHKLSEIFNPSLTTITLLLAMFSLSMQGLDWIIPNNGGFREIFRWIYQMLTVGIPPIDSPLDVLNLLNVIFLVIIALFAIVMLIYLAVSWIIVNLIRVIKHRNHVGKDVLPDNELAKETAYMKLGIHIETNDNKLVDSIRSLTDSISRNNNKDK
jgi:hypothetical protein